jgi:integrase
MVLPDYKMIGGPKRFMDGHGRKSASFMQRYRLLTDSSRKLRSVSLQTTDLTVARRRAVKFVEDKLRKQLIASNPEASTVSKGIAAALKEYLADLNATGNSSKQIATVKMRIERIIKQAKFNEYAQVDGVKVVNAIDKLATKHKFGTATKNRHREAMRAWSGWMKRNHRWPINMLEDMALFKGDTTLARERAILSDGEFEKLLASVLVSKDRRNLSGEQRYWLYLTASQSGLRANELHSLKPSSFDLTSEPPTLTVHCTISKRRQTDTVVLSRDFARAIKPWLASLDHDRSIWGCSASWSDKAASMLRLDLEEASISHKRGKTVVDFHSFRAYRVTKALLSGRSSRTVMENVRLSSEALLMRYTKIPQAALVDLVDAVPMPKLPLRIVG